LKEPFIYERIVPLPSILAVLEKLKAQTLREGDVSVSMEGIDKYDLAQSLMSMLEKNSGELSIKKEGTHIKARSLITKKVTDVPACLSFIRDMTALREVREVRLNLILSDGTKISTYRFSEGPDNHTLYIIGTDEVIDIVSGILGEKKMKITKEVEEESEEYCVYCGAYRGMKKTCPACGR